MANLHNHTDKGSFDSVIKHDDFVKRIQELNQEYVVQTDHGSLNAMISLAKKTYKAGLKYIPGIELYVTWGDKPIKEKDEFGKLYYHMLAIAKNNTGLKNLQNLLALSYTKDHFYMKPRVSIRELFNHKEGLIITSGCLASLTSQSLLFEHYYNNAEDQAAFALEKRRAAFASGVSCDDHIFDDDFLKTCTDLKGARSAREIIDLFAYEFKDDFYIEIQDNGAEEQYIINDALIQIAKEKGLPLIATSDAHYLRKEDEHIRRHKLMIRNNALGNSDDPDAVGEFYDGGSIYLKSAQELAEVLPHESITNTLDLARKCDVSFDFSKNYFPIVKHLLDKQFSSFEDPEFEEVKDICAFGMRKYKFDKDNSYTERLEEELQTIKELGFIPYFLALYYILKKGKEQGIFFGAGRGSAAGSLVCYLMGITDIDPIKYGLYFSRFLNKHRVSLPDVDTDCDSEQRETVFQIVKDMFGAEKVGKVITFGQLKPRSAAKDLGRIMGVPELGVKVASLIPPPLHGVEPTIEECFKFVPELSDEKYKIITEKMKELQGLTRSEGVHAAGLVIAPEDISNLSPYKIAIEKGSTDIILGLSVEELEDAGLIKYDFLGLRNLTILRKTIDYLKLKDIEFSLDMIPEHDDKVYEYIRASEDFGGLFQVEGSAGFSSLLKQIKPKCLDDIAIVSALYRPGPLGVKMHEVLIQRKEEGWQPSSYLDRLLSDTYGCLVYQEQLMLASMKLANFSESDADALRKAIGKKKPEDLIKWKDVFINGCKQVGLISESEADRIWETIESSGSYSFNKSHSISYAKLTYQCAYLKYYFLDEFIAALISASFDKKDKLAQALKTAKLSGVTLLPPSISNLHEETLPVSKNKIRLGLSVCKSLKSNATYLLDVVEKDNPQTIFDLFQKVNRSKFNIANAQAIAKAGVLDSFIDNTAMSREGLIEYIKELYSFYQIYEKKEAQYNAWLERKKERERQETLKSLGLDYGKRLASVGKEPEIPSPPDISNYVSIPQDLLQEALYEYQILGIYINYHPLELLDMPLSLTNIGDLEELATEYKNKTKYDIAGIITQFNLIKTRKKQVMAEFIIEDERGMSKVNLFPKAYSQLSHLFNKGKIDDYSFAVASVTAKRDRFGNVTISVEDMSLIDLHNSAIAEAYKKPKYKMKDNTFSNFSTELPSSPKQVIKKRFNSFFDFLSWFEQQDIDKPNQILDISLGKLSFKKEN